MKRDLIAEALPEPLTFDQFCRQVKPALTLVRQQDLRNLLKALYQVVKEKEQFEVWREGASTARTELRKKRQTMVGVERALAKALKTLDKVYLEFAEQIREIDATLGIPDDRWTFRNAFMYLFKAKGRAVAFQKLYSGLIHHELRDQPHEKQQASEPLAGGVVAGAVLPHCYPARPDSPDIDHWFIGAAAECLDQYKTGQGTSIPGYGPIILNLFRVAFRDNTRTLKSITVELQRQRASGRPQYVPLPGTTGTSTK